MMVAIARDEFEKHSRCMSPLSPFFPTTYPDIIIISAVIRTMGPHKLLFCCIELLGDISGFFAGIYKYLLERLKVLYDLAKCTLRQR